MKAIIYSSLDPAGKNIASQLVARHNFREAPPFAGRFPAWKNGEGVLLAEIGTPTITSDYLDEFFGVKHGFGLIVFASRHKSESGKPTLTAHACGNWGNKAEFGGAPRTLAPTSARALRAAMLSLSDAAVPGFEVVMECTHHGPLLSTPFVYVEVGSTEKEWGIEEAGNAAAGACLAACGADAGEAGKARVAIGLGGVHYPREITKEVLRSGIAVGHVCPKYAFESLDEGMLSQMLEKSGGKVELALIDWKSLKSWERGKAASMLKSFSMPFEKV